MAGGHIEPSAGREGLRNVRGDMQTTGSRKPVARTSD